jgi:hypothetical protein
VRRVHRCTQEHATHEEATRRYKPVIHVASEHLGSHPQQCPRGLGHIAVGIDVGELELMQGYIPIQVDSRVTP